MKLLLIFVTWTVLATVTQSFTLRHHRVCTNSVSVLHASRKKYGPSAGYDNAGKASKGFAPPVIEKRNPLKAADPDVDSVKAGEPVKVEPVKAAKPVDKEPIKIEPVKAESVKKEPVKAGEPVEAAKPVNKEPIKIEPVKAESVKKEPVKVEVVKVAEPMEVKASVPEIVVEKKEPVVAAIVVEKEKNNKEASVTGVKTEAVEAVEKEETEPELEPEPVTLSLEDQLRFEVQQEFESREARMKEINKLQDELSQSLQKKSEVDLVIERELKALFPRLKDEFFKETARVDQLTSSYTKFKEASLVKREIISNEENVLAQMLAVRQNIKEATILNQLDEAIGTKEELVKIETSICDEIDECTEALEAQIADTRTKLASLNNAISSLPSLEDKTSMNSYTWEDVGSLQSQLYSSMQSSRDRDEKVEEFLIKFEDAMRRRGIVLGENTELSPILTAATGVRSSVQNARKSMAESSEPTFNKKAATLEQMNALMETKNNEDLLEAALGALRRTLIGLGALTGNFVSSTTSFFDSKEGNEVVSSGKATLNGLTGATNDIKNAVEASQKTWESVSKTTADSTDQSVENIIRGVKAVYKSEEVRSALGAASSKASQSGSIAAEALSTVASTAGEDLKRNKVKAALFDIQEGLTELAGVTMVASGRLAGELQKQSRQLPGGGELK